MNNKKTGHFQSFFFFFIPSTLNLKKKSRKSTDKKKSGLSTKITLAHFCFFVSEFWLLH